MKNKQKHGVVGLSPYQIYMKRNTNETWETFGNNAGVSKHLGVCCPVDSPYGSPAKFFHFISGFQN